QSLHLPDRHALSRAGAVICEERARPTRRLDQDRAGPVLCRMEPPGVQVEVVSLDRADVLGRSRCPVVRGGISGRRIRMWWSIGERARRAARPLAPRFIPSTSFGLLATVTPEVRGPAISSLICEPRAEELMDAPEGRDGDGYFQKLRSKPRRLLEKPLTESG